MLVLFSPLSVIRWGAAACLQTQLTGTRGRSSTTAGLSVSVLPLRVPLARLPKVKFTAPSFMDTDDIQLLTIRSASGRPAAALSAGKLLLVAQAALTGLVASSASGNASGIWSRTILSIVVGSAIRANIAMTEITSIISIRVKPESKRRRFCGVRRMQRVFGMA